MFIYFILTQNDSQEVHLVPFSICSIFLLFEQNIQEIKQAPVVQKVDNTTYWIK